MLVRVCLAATAAVAVVMLAVAMGSDRGQPASAQTSSTSATADCGTGNPLDGRTQDIVDAIVADLKSGGTLTASQTCSDVTDVATLANVSFSLDLNYAGITQIRARDFEGLTGVVFLQLVSNELTTIPADAFVGLTGMTGLWLNDNQLTTVEVGAFNGLTALRRLFLSDNRLSTLPATVFSGSSLTSLRELYLPENYVESLPDTIFHGLPALTQIGLADNFLTSDNLGFLSTSIPTLQNLGLSDNVLTSDGSGPHPDLPTNIFGIHPMLHTLNLNDNGISELPTGVFSGMKAVRRFDIERNRITRLQSGLFQGVTWWSSSFSGGQIRFNGNLIRTVEEDVFNGGPCEPPASPSPSDPTNCLRHIGLEYNLIESVPAGLFSGLTSLRDARLTGNMLTTVPAGLFSGLSRVTWVYLAQNQIESLPDGIWSDLQALYRVNLHDNKLTSIPAGVFNGLPTVASGQNMGLPERPRVMSLWDNQFPEAEQTAMQARLPLTSLDFVNPFPARPRVIPEDDGTREERAYCGPGHTLTGRTIDIAWLIMRAAYPAPDQWPAAVATNPSPSLQSSWPFTLAAWQTRHGTPGTDPTIISPALCNLITADDLTKMTRIFITRRMYNLNANDFAGLTNLRSLVLSQTWDATRIRAFPAGIFDGLSSLRHLEMRLGLVSTLPDGIFDDLTDLRSLSLGLNLLTSLPDGVFDNNRKLESILLSQNMLSSLPQGVFSGLTKMRTLELQLNDLDEDDFPVGIFDGLSELRSLQLWGNNFRTLYLDVFANQGLSSLRVLRIGEQNPDRTTPAEFAAFQRHLPSLTRFDRLTGAQLLAATPTPTPTVTPTPTFHERLELPIVTKVEPVVRSFTVSAGDEIRLSFAMYNIQDALDNDLFTHDSLRIIWSDTAGGTFSESRGIGADRDGQIDDREVMWRAPNQPGRHTVTAKIEPEWACSGGTNLCAAVYTVVIVRNAATSTPEPTPCPTSGSVPTSIAASDGTAYSVITPAEGGEFVGDDVAVTFPRGALHGCTFLGLRAYVVADANASTRVRYGNRTVGGRRYAVDMASSEGQTLANVVTRRPADVCVPLPDEFRATLAGLTLLREIGGGVQELTSKVRRHETIGYTLCGAVSEFPAVVVAASRGDFGSTVAPSPTPVAETPEAGGSAPGGMYVLLAFLLGVLALTGMHRIGRISRMGGRRDVDSR